MKHYHFVLRILGCCQLVRGSLTQQSLNMESRCCLNTGDWQLSVLASGEGTSISYLCEPEQSRHNINEGLVIVPIITAMSQSQRWVMKTGFVNIYWSHLRATLAAKRRLLTSAWPTKAQRPHFSLRFKVQCPVWCATIFYFFCLFRGFFVLFWEDLKLRLTVWHSHTGVFIYFAWLDVTQVEVWRRQAGIYEGSPNVTRNVFFFFQTW